MYDKKDYDLENEDSTTEDTVAEDNASENNFENKDIENSQDTNSFDGDKSDSTDEKEDSVYSYTASDLNNMGSPRFEDFNNPDTPPTIPPVQRGNNKFLTLSVVLFVVSIVVGIILIKYYGDRKGNVVGGQSGLPTHEYTSTIVEHTKTEPPKNDVYSDKAELYSNAQKSCVTVICSVTKNFYGQVTESVSLGSGFVVSEEGYIVTNAHVVEGGSKYKVRFYDGTEANALLVGKDTACDIAVVKISSKEKLIPVSFGDSTKVRVGDFAMAIGTPSSEDLFGTMTFGVISGLNRRINITNSSGQISKTMLLLQTDATLNPGNSGGPLFNMHGQVIGINTMKLSDEYEGIGFAIPSSGAVKIINSLISLGKADYTDSEYVKGGAQLGIKGVSINEESKKKYGFTDEISEGALVVSIEKKSSAYKAGLSVYDVICEFNGKKIKTIEQLIQEVQKCSPGDNVTIKIYRAGRMGKKGEYHTYTFQLDSVEG